MPPTLPKTIPLIGASRGLGYAMAAEYLKHGWNVVGTVRGTARTFLHDLADESRSRLEIETVDICEPNQIAALRARLSGRIFDVLFVSAGVTNNPTETIAVVTTAEFVRVMVTNALAPMLVTVTGMVTLTRLGELARASAATPVMPAVSVKLPEGGVE